ncbi:MULTISPECIES: thioesterase family protein [Staphylococcus]|uniref:Thioesterase family protein n=1 Tax=Staphylococcus hsinchuensis TaxID=3051183 RepID=A0ABZ3EDM9_9STAP|nr:MULTISPECIES: thioesterase family protein [unclassified Staphylococcus]
MSKNFKLTQTVTEDMIDHNGHVHDANYNILFSKAINEFNYENGLSLEEREQLKYTMFTVEEHTSYLAELLKNEAFEINVYIYNYDEKRVHFFNIMTKPDGTTVATNEVMMLGISRETRKTAPFPEQYAKQIQQYYKEQPQIDWPKQLGHRIDIPK